MPTSRVPSLFRTSWLHLKETTLFYVIGAFFDTEVAACQCIPGQPELLTVVALNLARVIWHVE